MKGMRPATQFLLCWLAAGSMAVAQTVDLASDAGKRIVDGHAAGARAGAWLHVGDITGDFWNKELIVGVPDEASGAGTVRLYIGGQRTVTGMTTQNANVVLTGAAAGDQFGAAADAGYVTVREVEFDNRGNPTGPTPPRDVIVGAPGALSGRGAVYIFPGPFTGNTSRTTADAVVRILGTTPGDRLGAVIESADLNNDGFREVVLPVASRGIIYVVDVHSVHTSTSTTIDLAASVPGMVITGLAGDIAVASGDVTGDTVLDLAIGMPGAQGARGAVFLITGRTRVLPATMSVSAADAQLVGADPGDGFGTSLWVADIDDDGDIAAELLVGAPRADGAGNARADAGEVHIIWGRAEFASAFPSGLVLYGAAAGHRLGTRVTAGHVTRKVPFDVVMLAGGANGGAGEVFAYYGRHLFDFPSSSADMATDASRRITSDETAGAIETIRVWEATGEGAEEIVIGVPSASTAAGQRAGRVYFPLSPRLELSTGSVGMRAVQCAAASASLEIRNPSDVPVPWRLFDPPSWVEIQPAAGTTVLDGPATVRLVVRTADLSPGTYTQRVEVISGGPHLGHTAAVNIQVTVDAATPLQSNGNVDFNGDGCGDLAIFQPSTGTWHVPGEPGRQLGSAGDTPVAGDYNGDAIAEIAVYRPATATWFFTDGSSVQHGAPGDLPVPADYDGDGKTDMAVYKRGTATWLVWGRTPVQWGAIGDVPVPGDYDGNGAAEPAVFRRSDGTWRIHGGVVVSWGIGSDVPVPADYDGDGTTDIAVYRRATGEWDVLGQFTQAWGSPADVPVPADVDRDGRPDLTVYRRASSTWEVLSMATGVQSTISVPGGVPAVGRAGVVTSGPHDFGGDGVSDIAVWRGTSGVWFVRESSTAFGTSWSMPWGSDALKDVPLSGDFDGDGRNDPTVWRPASGSWLILRSKTGFADSLSIQWGSSSLRDIPVAGDFDGDARTDLTVWRPGEGNWYIRRSLSDFADHLRVNWGAGHLGDLPVAADYDGDGRTDVAVWRPGDGAWYILKSSTGFSPPASARIVWGAGHLGDVPVTGDFDGDGQADLTVWRPAEGNWYVLTSASGFSPGSSLRIRWGSQSLGDIPIGGDFDADGRTDITVWRPGTGRWYVLTSSSNFTASRTFDWGTGSLRDVPVGGVRPR